MVVGYAEGNLEATVQKRVRGDHDAGGIQQHGECLKDHIAG